MEMVYEYFPVLKSRAEQRAGSLSAASMLGDQPGADGPPGHDAAGRAGPAGLVKEIFDIIVRMTGEWGYALLSSRTPTWP